MSKQSSSPQNRRTASSSARGTGSARRTPSTRRRTSQNQQSAVAFGFPWRKQNLIGIGAGIVVIIIGYLLMGTAITKDVANNDGIWNNSSAVTFGPMLLTIGYCVIVPFFIFRRFGTDEPVGSESL